MRPARWPRERALCLVTDAALCAPRGLLEVVAAAVAGGVGLVQLREKTLATRDFVERARALKALLAPLGVPLLINDRLDVALAAGADGVHLGQDDLAVEDARRWLAPGALIGLSIETLAQVAQVPEGVDYLGVGPVYATATKADAAPPLGLDGLAAVRAASALPVMAIGGIGLAQAPAVIAAGAHSLAVVSAICAAPDPRGAAAALAACFDA